MTHHKKEEQLIMISSSNKQKKMKILIILRKSMDLTVSLEMISLDSMTQIPKTSNNIRTKQKDLILSKKKEN